MVKHVKILYGFVAIIGLIFLSPLLSSMLHGAISVTMVMPGFFLAIVGTVFLISGIYGIGIQYLRKDQNLSAPQPEVTGKSMGRYPKLYGLIAVLGIVFLGVFFTMAYWGGRVAVVSGFFQSTPLAGALLFIVFLFGGTGLLTVGGCGIVRQHFGNYQNLFIMFVAILIPSLILMPLCYWWVSALEVGL